MQMHRQVMKTAAGLFVLFLLVIMTGISRAERVPEPSNRIVIVIDGSGSYKSRQGEAVNRAVTLLDEIARTKLQRWESETDVITIISLDAMPDILWQGNLQELKATDTKEWTKRFLARSDYSACTDVGAAFNLAVPHLAGDPRYVSKFLLVFSDLVDEPPTKSVRKCRTANPAPPSNFPWESLKDVSVSVFWAPPDQKLLWRQAAEQHGVSSTFALYTTSESSNVAIAPPPRPVVKVTEADRRQDRERFKEIGAGVVKWGGWTLLALVVLPLFGAILGRLLRGRSRTAQSTHARRVPPLPVAGASHRNPPHPMGPRPIGPLPPHPGHRPGP